MEFVARLADEILIGFICYLFFQTTILHLFWSDLFQYQPCAKRQNVAYPTKKFFAQKFPNCEFDSIFTLNYLNYFSTNKKIKKTNSTLQ
jgi:hypothetical protein